MARDDYDSDLFTIAAAIAGGIILLNLLRYWGQSAGLVFPATAPGADLPNMLGLPYSVSPDGRQFIKDQEKFSPYPYTDGNAQSVGFGHQIQPGESFKYPLTFDVGNQLFDKDIANAETVINRTVTVPLSQNQVDAIGDFVYRIGAGNWKKSEALRLLNQGNYAGAAQAFNNFVKTGGQVSTDLQERAQAEQQTFNQGVA